MKNFKELIIWKKGIELVKETYKVSQQFPTTEKFGLISQMTRALVSIPANISEGSGRTSDKDYARFLHISLGSAFELQTYFVIGKEMGRLNVEELQVAENLLNEEIKMIHAFIKK